MKTIEQKAKDFDKALTKARKYYEETPNNVYKAMLENLFPELAESEDEKIRKTIIDFLKNIEEENESYLIFDNTTTTDMIAWLEKQGSEPNWCHHKVDLSNCSEEYRKAYYDGWNNCNMQHSQCKSEGNDVVKCLINGMKFYYEDNEEATWGTEKFPMKVKDILSWLEKQGEQKSTECIKFNNEFENQVSHLIASVLNGEHEYNEGFVKYVAQSLLSYVKNELKAEEWTEEDENMCRYIGNAITCKESAKYLEEKGVDMIKAHRWLESPKHQSKQEWSEEDEDDLNNIIWLCDNCIKKCEHTWIPSQATRIKSLIERIKDIVFLQPKQEWSEEDEKVRKSLISFLKSPFVNENITDEKVAPWLTWLEKQGNPNKEYWRGYKDGKKAILDRYSELKTQGEQKPVVIIPKFRVGDEVITENEESLTITRIDEEGYWSNDLFICGFDDSAEWKLVEQKPIEWKQENREELTEFENAMMHIGGSFFGENAGLDPNDTDTIKEQAGLLLELAPKTEWSEEDEVKINRIVSLLENLKVAENDILLKDIDWLKSLRPHINVTDKEFAQARKEAYNEVLDKIEYHDEWPTFDDGWNAAIWYLKKRNGRPQSHWKPSNEQIIALRWVLNNIPYNRHKEEISGLLEQLKKLKGE